MNGQIEQLALRQDIIQELRTKAAKGSTVRELVGVIQSRLECGDQALLVVLWYFTAAFRVPLRQVLPIREWLGSNNDEEIDGEILPAIAATRHLWVSADGDPLVGAATSDRASGTVK
jgi:hypothetical protein